MSGDIDPSAVFYFSTILSTEDFQNLLGLNEPQDNEPHDNSLLLDTEQHIPITEPKSQEETRDVVASNNYTPPQKRVRPMISQYDAKFAAANPWILSETAKRTTATISPRNVIDDSLFSISARYCEKTYKTTWVPRYMLKREEIFHAIHLGVYKTKEEAMAVREIGARIFFALGDAPLNEKYLSASLSKLEKPEYYINKVQEILIKSKTVPPEFKNELKQSNIFDNLIEEIKNNKKTKTLNYRM